VSTSANDDLRALLFGDVPMEAWPPGDTADAEPWAGFVRARADLAAGDQDLAIREWGAIAAFGDHEPRHILQAWHFLRGCNVHPDDAIAATVLGVVAEVAVDGAHDVLAAYRDGSVRYLNHGGGATVADAGDLEPVEVVDAVAHLVAIGQTVAPTIGVWAEPARPALPVGHSRFTMLTPGGARFVQGPDDALRADATATGLFAAATELLQRVVAI